MKRTVLFCLVLLFSLVFSEYGHFPSYLPTCSRSDKDFETCLATSLETYFKVAATQGIPEDGIPKSDPLDIPYIFLYAAGKSMNLKHRYVNIKLYGLKESTITDAHLNFDKNTLTFTQFVPNLHAVAIYQFEGQIFGIPALQSGIASIVFENNKIDHTIQFEEYDKLHLVKSHTIKWSIEGANFNYDNVFGGNPLLSHMIQKLMNINWKAVIDDIMEDVERAYGVVFGSLSSKFFNAQPLNEIFID